MGVERQVITTLRGHKSYTQKKEGDWVEKAVRSLTMCTVLVVYCLMEIGQYSLWLDKYICT